MAAKKKGAQMTLEEMLLVKIQSLLDIEQQIIKALPKMAKATSNPELKAGFQTHLKETEGQAKRLIEALDMLSAPKGKEKVEGIRGIIKDGEWILKNIKDPAARDSMLIGAAQYVEHYEMAGYATAIQLANELGEDNVAALLEETLAEEESTSETLTSLAPTIIGEVANPDEDEEE